MDIAERNINRVARAAQEAGISLRPHIKAHKSVFFTKKQIYAGAKGITVAKIAEAEVMAENGVDDILVAYPVLGEEKLSRLKKLHERARILTIVDSIEVAAGLAGVGSKEHPVQALVDIDSGIHRGGRQPGEDALRFALELKSFEGLAIKGAFTYNGAIYQSASRTEMEANAEAEARILTETANLLRTNGIPVSILSGGSTPATVVLSKLNGVTEIRSGNYIFHDAAALALGIADVEDCALRILATVVSIPVPGYATIDAGSKTLTSDLAKYEGYGYIIGMPDVVITKLNEEHGFLRYDPKVHKLRIGDKMEIIPNHACVIPNLCDSIYGVRGERFEREIKIEARGKNY